MPVLSGLLVVPRDTDGRGIPTEVPIGIEHGMPSEGVLSLDNVTTMPKAFLRERICELPAERMRRVCDALALATGCA